MFPDTSVAIVIVSDTCSLDPSTDVTGVALLEAIDEAALTGVTTVKYTPDNKEDIQEVLRSLIAENYNIIFTAGGTGFSPRDVTPEAVKPFIEKDAPGIVGAMLKSSLEITPLAAMSRPVAGVSNSTLIITLPGSPKGAVENFKSISGVLPHAVKLLTGFDSRELHAPADTLTRSASISHSRTPSAVSGSSRAANPPYESLSSLSSSSNEIMGHSNENEHSHSHGPSHSHSHSHGHGHNHSHSHSHSHSHGHSGPKFYGPAHRDRQSPYPLVPFDDALSIILENAPSPVSAEVTLEESLGCVLAKDIIAPVNVPSFRASIVDGYAVSHTDFANCSEVVLPVSKVSLASSELGVLPPRSCARITTGAPVPYGATAVIPVENTEIANEKDGEEVDVKLIATNVNTGDNIREIGSDIALGELVLPQNTIISTLGGEVGVLASLGITKVTVYRKPVVGVMSTGDEVIDAGEGLSGSQIWDSNRPMLLANLRSWLGGFNVVDLGIVLDDIDILKDRFVEALANVDVLITSGGVSMGELDLVKPLIKSLGGDIKLGRVLMKPGKPMTFATLPFNKLVLALPGNPVSCVVCLQLFGHPLLMKMMGSVDNGSRNWIEVELKSGIKLDTRPEFQRGLATVTPDGKWVWDSTGFQRSSCITSMARANSLIRLPKASNDLKFLPKGSKVKALLLGINKMQ